MKPNNSKHIRVLGIAASSFGIGFAVIEGENILVDWGTKSVKGDKNAKSLSNVGNLIARYHPNAIVLEDTKPENSRRGSRVQALNKEIVKMAEDQKIRVKRFSRKQVSVGFLSSEQGTKHALAEHLADRFPDELGMHLPPKRRAWDNEDCRMDIFDAVALGLMIRQDY